MGRTDQDFLTRARGFLWTGLGGCAVTTVPVTLVTGVAPSRIPSRGRWVAADGAVARGFAGGVGMKCSAGAELSGVAFGGDVARVRIGPAASAQVC